MHDLVIRDATLVDGTGADARPADIAVDDGDDHRGRRPGAPRRRRRAPHRRRRRPARHPRLRRPPHPLRRPGHVGPAAHAVVLARRHHRGHGQLRRRLRAGAARASEDWLIQLMEGVEDIPGTALTEGITWGWETFPEYLDALDTMPRVDGRRHAGAARRGARLRDGRARRPQRARHPRRHRGDGRPRARGHPAPARSASRRRARSCTRRSTASRCPAPSPPRTSCSASARCSASSAPGSSSSRPRA